MPALNPPPLTNSLTQTVRSFNMNMNGVRGPRGVALLTPPLLLTQLKMASKKRLREVEEGVVEDGEEQKSPKRFRPGDDIDLPSSKLYALYGSRWIYGARKK